MFKTDLLGFRPGARRKSIPGPVTFVTCCAVMELATLHRVTIRRKLSVLVCVAGLALAAQANQLAIVSDTTNTTTNIAAGDLVKIFNGRNKNWPDGKAIKIVMRDPSSTDMQLVLRKLLNMTPEQARAFIQTHREAIVIADSDDAVLRFVSTSPGALGVVDLYSLTKNVNVVKIDGKLPVEQGYLLRGN
jgi:ABC-type phosphate transport system substrate-binding protein